MRSFIRQTLKFLRWPLGVIAVLGLPAAIRTASHGMVPLFNADHLPFWCGCMLIFGLWVWRWRHARWGRFLTTIEHESLHAIVGMLTLIPVRELKVREDGSGHVLFEPPGHWLLYLAPYFMPLLLLIEVGLVRLLALPDNIEDAVLGAILALSLLGHLQQFHPRQTDFRHAGIVFTIAFLPTAFLMGYGAAFTMLRGGNPAALWDLFSTWGAQTWADTTWAWALLIDRVNA